MWLFMLSLLAIESVQSASIGYPYRSLWTYDQPKTSSIHGYLSYLDNKAATGLVGINNQQPVYAVRQIKYFNSAATAPETLAITNSEEIAKARETYLRAASLQQYQSLKNNIDALKNEGKEPSAEELLKLDMLQKIAFTSDFSLIAELPDVKSTLLELEASISALRRESDQQNSNQQRNVDQNQGEIKTYVGNTNTPLVAIDKTPEQKHAHEDHLRIYNEQIAHLKQLELEHQKYVQEASAKSNIAQSSIIEPVDNSKALAEFERAQQEHLRLWNEAKERAEQAGHENSKKDIYERANKQQISALTNDQNIYSTKQTIPTNQSPETQQLNKQFEQQRLKTDITQQLNDKSNLKTEQLRAVEQISGQHQVVVDTPEVVRAREEHLRIVNEAISKAQAEPQLDPKQQQSIELSQQEKAKSSLESLGQQNLASQSQTQKASSAAINYRAEQSFAEETAEVKKAREEHLRLVQEANLRAQYVEQQELQYKHESQTPILKSQNENQQHSAYHTEISQGAHETPELAKARLINDAQIEGQIIGETAEVQRARDEHLRIFNSIKSHTEKEQAKENSRNLPNTSPEQNPILDFSLGEERLLELERLREAERLKKEQQLLEIERVREAERLAEEKREMEAELMRLRLEDEQRLEMERFLEDKRLREEQEELQKLRTGEYQEIIIQNDSVDQQPQIAVISTSNLNVEQGRSQQSTDVVQQQNEQYVSNPFLKIGKVSGEPANRLDHPAGQQSSLLKSIPVQHSSNTHQHNVVTSKSAAPSGYNTVPQYIPSSHHSSGSKYSYIKDDNIKQIYHSGTTSQTSDSEHYIPSSHYYNENKYQYNKDENIQPIYHATASSLPVDTEHYIPSAHHTGEIQHQYLKDDNFKHMYYSAGTSQSSDNAAALIALEKATNDHFRAHELVLEQLRLARLQNPSIKDCN